MSANSVTHYARPKADGAERKGVSFSYNKITLLIMGLPCFCLLLVFSYLPLLGWSIAFFDYKPGLNLFECNFTGLKYFKLALFEPELIPVMRNTLVMSLLNLLAMPLPMIFAIFLSEMRSEKTKRFIQTTTTFPYFISWVLVFSVMYALFSTGDGLFNKLLAGSGKVLNVLGNKDIVWFFQAGIVVWKTMGFSAIVYLAAIAGISPELYDAASVDGAGRFRKILHVTLPGLTPTFMVLLILGIGNMLSTGFEQYYLFYNPLVHDKIQVLDYYVYRIGIALNDYPLSTALGISKSLVSITLLTLANLASRRINGKGIF